MKPGGHVALGSKSPISLVGWVGERALPDLIIATERDEGLPSSRDKPGIGNMDTKFGNGMKPSSPCFVGPGCKSGLYSFVLRVLLEELRNWY